MIISITGVQINNLAVIGEKGDLSGFENLTGLINKIFLSSAENLNEILSIKIVFLQNIKMNF